MKRTLLFCGIVLGMLVGMCTNNLSAQATDSVYVSFTPLPGSNPLATASGVLHGDDCDSVEIVLLVFTWHGRFPDYQVPLPGGWKAGRGQDVQKNLEYPDGQGFPEDAHVWYHVWPGGALQTLDIDPLVPGRPYQLAPPCPPLPIQLSSFVGTVINNRVRLDWTTVSEVNNYGFFVQKKRTGETEWSEIPNSFVAGHGTTHIPHHYTFTDDAVITTPVEYRLKQLDLDGTIHYTEPIRIENPTTVKESAPREFALQQNSPNPFNPSTKIGFQIADYGLVTLKVYDVLGREVATLVNEMKQPGTYTVRFDGRGLASGVYFYRLQAGGLIASKKLLLLK